MAKSIDLCFVELQDNGDEESFTVIINAPGVHGYIEFHKYFKPIKYKLRELLDDAKEE